MAYSFPVNAPTIYETVQYTYRNPAVKSRFYNMKRDVLRSRVTIKKVVNLSVDRLNQPAISYEIISRSYPQYPPYNTHKVKQAKKRSTDVKKQRTTKHEYDIKLELEYLATSSRYKLRVGSQKKWNPKPSQKHIKTIYRETMEQWKKKCTDRKTNKLDKEKLNKMIEKHKQSAKYLDVGDYNSQKLGLMGDCYFRLHPILAKYKILYGKSWYKETPKDIDYPFFDKHTLNVIFFLIKRNILLNDTMMRVK